MLAVFVFGAVLVAIGVYYIVTGKSDQRKLKEAGAK